MVIAKAAPAACGSELRVPNVLFRIWTGVCCPPLLDFVSLLVAVLQLRPERIEYLLTPRMPANLTALRGFDGEVGRCFAALGNVNLVRLNFSTGSPLRLATSGFHAWDSGFWANGAPRIKYVALTDVLRAYALHTFGGMYLDGDAFVLNGEAFQDWRRCPAVLSAESHGWWAADPHVDETDGRVQMPEAESDARNGSHASTMNSAVMLSVANSSFSQAWFNVVSKWDGRPGGAHDVCCYWPARFEAANPAIAHGAIDFRSFPLYLSNLSSLPTASVEAALKMRPPPKESYSAWTSIARAMVKPNRHHGSTSVVHLSNSRIRSPTGAYEAVMAEALRLAVAKRGGHNALAPSERMCVATAENALASQIRG